MRGQRIERLLKKAQSTGKKADIQDSIGDMTRILEQALQFVGSLSGKGWVHSPLNSDISIIQTILLLNGPDIPTWVYPFVTHFFLKQREGISDIDACTVWSRCGSVWMPNVTRTR